MHRLIECTTAQMLPEIAQALLTFVPEERIFLFYGDLGAGKTTLIKSVCKLLGVKEQVSSPTFSIINEYKAKDRPVYHFDLYRLKNIEEAMDIGLEEYIESGAYCFIEWPEKIEAFIQGNIIKVLIKAHADGSRIIHMELIGK